MTFPIRGVVKLTGDLLRRGGLPLALVTLCFSLLPTWGVKFAPWLIFNSAWRDILFAPHGLGPAAFVFVVISWFVRGFHMSAVTEIALRTAASKPITPGRLVLSAAVHTLPILLLQTALALLVVTGCLLLVVPGLFLGAAFSVVVPAYICEGKSLPEAFRQSFKLTQRRRLPIGALWFSIIFVVDLFTGGLLSAATAFESVIHQILPTFSLPPLPAPTPVSPFFAAPLGIVLTTIVNQAYTVVLMVLNVAIYLGLRFHKTETADTQFAAIFE